MAAGKPVVVLLPPQNIKVRAFVPETQVGSIHYGDTVAGDSGRRAKPFHRQSQLHLAARGIHAAGHLQPREPRKLVFMIESVFDPEVSANLHPGQPVDVEFKSK